MVQPLQCAMDLQWIHSGFAMDLQWICKSDPSTPSTPLNLFTFNPSTLPRQALNPSTLQAFNPSTIPPFIVVLVVDEVEGVGGVDGVEGVEGG